MRVVHLFPELVMGGADRAVLDLIRLLPARGYDCTLCVLRERGRFPLRELVPDDLVPLGHEGPVTRLRALAGTARRLRALLRRTGAVLLHTHLWPADVVGAAANLDARIRHVSHQQGTGPELLRRAVRPRIKRLASRHLMRRSRTHFVAVSRSVQAHTARLYGISPSRIDVAHNAFSAERFPAPSRDEPREAGRLGIGFAGRFATEKGVEDLLRAVAAVRARGIDARLEVAGEGPLRTSYETLSRSLGIEGVVAWRGSVADMASFYAGLEVFALPSLHSEGFSLSLVEAMAMGCVPVASDVPGVREAITDASNGYVLPPGRPDLLAARLEQLARDPAHRLAIGRAAMSSARSQFTVDGLADRVAAIYERVLSGDSSMPEAHAR